MLDDFVLESVSAETLDRWLKRKTSSRPAGMPTQTHAYGQTWKQTHIKPQLLGSLWYIWSDQRIPKCCCRYSALVKHFDFFFFAHTVSYEFLTNHSETQPALNICSCFIVLKKTTRLPELRLSLSLRVIFIILAVCSTNHSSSHVSPLIVSVCDRQTLGEKQQACWVFTGHLMCLSGPSWVYVVHSTHSGLFLRPTASIKGPQCWHSAQSSCWRQRRPPETCGWLKGAQGRGRDGGGCVMVGGGTGRV